MNRNEYILASSSPRSHVTPFSQSVMQHITRQKSLSHPLGWRHFALAILVVVVTSVIGFSGYAYAIGSDPMTLIRRWISGQTVMIDYDGRTFSHGTKLTYSDAAVTAAGELNLLDKAHFHDNNTLQVPRNGLEYVDDPYMYGDENYIYPKLAYLSRTPRGTIEVHEVFLRGDKMKPSQAIDATYTIPEDTLIYRSELTTSTLADNQPVLVSLYRNHYRRHILGNGSQTTPVTMSFAYKLTHPFDNYIEASQNPPVGGKTNASQATSDESLQTLIESNIGADTDICMNNGVDVCPSDEANRGEGLSLYGREDTRYGKTNRHNPDAVTQGEGGSSSRRDIIMREIQGKIIAVDSSQLRVITSSGAIWSLGFDQTHQSAFQKEYSKSLAIGNNLSATIYQPITELDNRAVSHTFIYQMVTIK